ncbi:MAG: hypothetical protein D6815_10295, partial [Candidatus Dadabacteria bacterium]
MSRPVEGFLSAVGGDGPIIILPHDNPDPDAIASAAGLDFLCRERLGKEAVICLGGIVARAENRAMLTYLDISLSPVADVDFSPPAKVVLVDTQPGRRNNSLPPGIVPTAVIDHHPAYEDLGGVPFVDLRDYGATASMVAEYLFDAGLEPDARVATALFYGIAAETQDLGREAKVVDVLVSQRLYPYTNKKRLAKIENARVPADYFRVFRDAIEHAEVVGKVVFCDLGEISYPDQAAEVADFLLRLDQVQWSAVAGYHEGRIYVSLRTTDRDANAGEVLRKVVGSNSAGGHGMI